MSGDHGVEAAAATFGLVTNDTRVGILRELAHHQRDNPEEPALPFAELRRRVEGRETGNFSYHLDRLTGRFVTGEDGGYRLTQLGMHLTATVLSGRYDPPTGLVHDLDATCRVCGDGVRVSYDEGLLRAACPADHGFADFVPPAAVEGRGADALVDLLALRVYQDTELLTQGVCALCSGPVGTATETTGEPAQPFTVAGTCEVCGLRSRSAPALCAFADPRVGAFLRERGVDPRRVRPWEPPLWATDRVERRGEEPFRLAVDVSADGDRLVAVLDDRGRAVDVSPPGDG
jgi:DNA-binding transcriptional ArsR family regulator